VADSNKFHRFVLTMQSPWNLPGQTEHKWSCKFSVSGSIDMNDADAEATAMDLWKPIRDLTSNLTSFVSWSFYLSGQNVSNSGAVYAPGIHTGTLGAYSSNAAPTAQLEVCILARSPVGKNTLGKPVYLRKWIHDVLQSTGDPNSHEPLNNASLTLTPWNAGAGPHQVVPVDPTSGDAGSGWVLENHLYTHQLRRGPRRKKQDTDGLSVSDALQDLAALRSLISKIPVE
jgi:hypothetical protein